MELPGSSTGKWMPRIRASAYCAAIVAASIGGWAVNEMLHSPPALLVALALWVALPLFAYAGVRIAQDNYSFEPLSSREWQIAIICLLGGLLALPLYMTAIWRSGEQITEKTSSKEWKPLTQDQILVLSEMMRARGKRTITFICIDSNCWELALSFSNAATLAGWEQPYPIESSMAGYPVGIEIGPRGLEAEWFKAAIETATGLEPTVSKYEWKNAADKLQLAIGPKLK